MTTQTNEVPLTRAAIEELSRELEYLRTVRRREVAEEIRDAWDSEIGKDADVAIPFESAKETQAFVEGRIATLEDILGHATVIDEEAARASDVVQLGSVVVIDNGDGEEHVYQIVGATESDPGSGKLSHESPVGAALIGRRAGDSVEVQVPAGVKRLRIKELR
jgi:transcription elongation factor GreA